MSTHVFRLVATLVLLNALAGCATPMQSNAPLPPTALRDDGKGISNGGYRLTALPEDKDASDLLVLLCFSGGGKRSSAFGYGVLKGLRDFSIPVDGKPRRLLDMVDMIASVSGGSFPAAYYGLYRERIFTDFEKDFLDQDIESYIWGTYLLPWNFRWMFDSGFGTNDRMAHIYDDLMFHGATYADLARQGRPMISIDATDVDHELAFPFTQEQFDLICSDLSSYSLARAVAASNGFPVLFTPITLTSHRSFCGDRVPYWVAQDKGSDPLSRSSQLAAAARQYLDADATKYVHLMDGGIADNLAMRGMINAMVILSGNDAMGGRLDISGIRRILLISADGQAANDAASARQPRLSGLGRIFSAVSGTQIDSYNFETLTLAQTEMDRLRDAIRKVRCAKGAQVGGDPCDDVQTYLAHLSLAGIADPATRTRLQAIPTGLTLSPEDVAQLVAAGEQEVRLSSDLARFRESLTPVTTALTGH